MRRLLGPLTLIVGLTVQAATPEPEVVDLFASSPGRAAAPEQATERECDEEAPVDLLSEQGDPCAVPSLDESLDCSRLARSELIKHPQCFLPAGLPRQEQRRILEIGTGYLRRLRLAAGRVRRAIREYPDDRFPLLDADDTPREVQACTSPGSPPEDPMGEILDPDYDFLPLIDWLPFLTDSSAALAAPPAWQAAMGGQMGYFFEWAMRRHRQWMDVFASRVPDPAASEARDLAMRYFEMAQLASTLRLQAYALDPHDPAARHATVAFIVTKLLSLPVELLQLQADSKALYDRLRTRPLAVPADPAQWTAWQEETRQLCEALDARLDRFMEWLNAELPWQRRMALAFVTGVLLRQPACNLLEAWIAIGMGLARQAAQNPERFRVLYALGKQVDDTIQSLAFSSLFFQAGGVEVLQETIRIERNRSATEEFVPRTEKGAMKDVRRATASNLARRAELVFREIRRIGRLTELLIRWRQALATALSSIEDEERGRRVRKVHADLDDFLKQLRRSLMRNSRFLSAIPKHVAYDAECHARLACFERTSPRKWVEVCGGKYFKCTLWRKTGWMDFHIGYNRFMHFASGLYPEIESLMARAQEALGMEEPPSIPDYCIYD